MAHTHDYPATCTDRFSDSGQLSEERWRSARPNAYSDILSPISDIISDSSFIGRSAQFTFH